MSTKSVEKIMVMGREFGDRLAEKKPNGLFVALNVVSHDKIHVAPRIAESIDANVCELRECTEKQYALGIRSTNLDASFPEAKNEKSVVNKLNDYKRSSSIGAKYHGNLRGDCTVPQPFELETEKRGVCTHPVGNETPFVGLNSLPNPNTSQSPGVKKNSQPNSPLKPKKHLQSDFQKHHEEDDNSSLTSSTGTSVQTARSKVTVGVAPTFKVDERLEKRKEYYTKLEEKHQALEEEKIQCEARSKEEQEAAIKQLRKTLVIKAKPVPSFYYEGPPPKVELKKMPLTRAKSPNFTRRKSCGDPVESYEEKGKVCTRSQRHSLGSYKPERNSPGIKGQINSRSPKGSCKVKGPSKPDKETSKTVSAKIPGLRNNRDVSVPY